MSHPAGPPIPPTPAGIRPDEDAESVWKAVIETLRGLPTREISEHAIEIWIAPLRVVGVLEGAIAVEGPERCMFWVRKRYGPVLGELIREEQTYRGLRVFVAPPAREDDLL